jgi:hypothetical protein
MVKIYEEKNLSWGKVVEKKSLNSLHFRGHGKGIYRTTELEIC